MDDNSKKIEKLKRRWNPNGYTKDKPEEYQENDEYLDNMKKLYGGNPDDTP